MSVNHSDEKSQEAIPHFSIILCVCLSAWATIRKSVYGKKQFLLYFRMTNSYRHYFCRSIHKQIFMDNH